MKVWTSLINLSLQIFHLEVDDLILWKVDSGDVVCTDPAQSQNTNAYFPKFTNASNYKIQLVNEKYSFVNQYRFANPGSVVDPEG